MPTDTDKTPCATFGYEQDGDCEARDRLIARVPSDG